METLPEDAIYDSRGRLERGVEDCWTTLRLGDPPGGGDFDVQVEPEVQRADDAVTVVLLARGRVRFGGQLRAPRVAVVTLAVIAVGMSIRLLRRPSGHGGVRSEATARHVAGVPSWRRERGAARSAHHQSEAFARRGAGRQREAVHRRTSLGERKVRTLPLTTSVPVRVQPVPTPPAGGYVPQVEPAPAADVPPPVRSEPQSAPAPRGRPPCLPGTLGC